MSGSNFTRTPNYNLYKPVPLADVDVWGDHLNFNADTLDAVIKTIENKAGVITFNTRAGAVTLLAADVSAATGLLTTGGTMSAAISFGNTAVNPATDLTKHLLLHTAGYGISVSNSRTNFVVPASGNLAHVVGGLDRLTVNNTAVTATVPVTLPADPTTALQAATKQYVDNRITALPANVASFNTRVGAVVLTLADITAAGGAPLASPTMTGVPAAPTAAPGTSTTQLATTAFVAAALLASGVASFNTRIGAVTLNNADVIGVLPASTAAPAMNGTAAAGAATTWSRGDHVHPVDISRAAVSALSNYLPIAGGNLTGALGVVTALAINAAAGNWATLNLTRAAGQGAQIAGYTGSSPRWTITLGDTAAESGGNAGSHFNIARFDDAGNYLDAPLTINRATGLVSITQQLVTGGQITSGGPMMNGGGVMYVAGNYAYWMGRDSADGLWKVVDNGNVLSGMDANGNMTSSGFLQGVGGVYPDNSGQWRLWYDAPNTLRTFKWQDGYNHCWNVSNGTLAYYVPGANQWFFPNDGSVINWWTWVGGVGAYHDVSDEHTKTDIAAAPHGLDTILAIRPITFRRWNQGKMDFESGGARLRRAAIARRVA